LIISIDFDGTVVDEASRPFADTTTPLQLMPGARKALAALKAARHILILASCRANRALRDDPTLDPLVRADRRPIDRVAWERARPIHQARYHQMLDFVAAELPGVFDAIDDGMQGKVCADLYIDNHALRFGAGLSGAGWASVAVEYGAVPG
jgi:hypothetical protein